MAIVTGITKRLDIPHEPGEWMELRRLSWRQREAAEDTQSNAALKRIKSLGGDILREIAGASRQQEQDVAARYDRAGILQAGIVRWSYDDEVTPANIDLLDETTAAWAFAEILALDEPRSEVERKNGLSPSTSRSKGRA